MRGNPILTIVSFVVLILTGTVLIAADQVPKPKMSYMRPGNLRCEFLKNPVGIDVRQPRLSWNFTADGAKLINHGQTAYRILVAKTDVGLLEENKDIVWDSGWVESDATNGIVYEGEPLTSDTTYYWNVRIRDNMQSESKPCAMAQWTTALLDPSEWTARWIGTGENFKTDGDGQNRPFDPWFRKVFSLTDRPETALLHLASVGFHEVYVNGVKVDDIIMTPAVTDNKHRARYITYDIAPYLMKGDNVIGVWLGTGWSIFSYYDSEDRPSEPIFKAQCDVRLINNETIRIQSDADWKTAPSNNKLLGHWGPGQFGGEYQDGDVIVSDWNTLQLDDSAWKNAVVCNPTLAVSAQSVEPDRIIVPVQPRSIEKMEEGVWRVDMGRNFAGWTEVTLNGNPGDVIEFEYSESPLSARTFNLFSRYKIGPSGHGVFRNHFNYSSGRWITIHGLEQAPTLDQIKGWLVRTDYKRESSFECSDELQNWIYETTLWTFENLSLGGYIVDCPQRERMGYGGDANATMETGMFNYRLDAFYSKWMQDWRDVQGWEQAWLDDTTNMIPGREEAVRAGTLPNTAPAYFGGGGPTWGGIVVTLPWFYYRHYGDEKILADNFEMMVKWLDFLNSYVENGLLRRYGDVWNFLGDWLWPGAEGGPNSFEEDALCLNNIFRVYNLQTAAKIARVLGKDEKAQEWEAMAEEGRKAVHERFFNAEDHSYYDGRMSIQGLALLAEIPPEELRNDVIKRLEDEILKNKEGHVGCGITGGAFLFHWLRQEGRDDLIYSMVSKTDFPSYGFMKENDATTLWEAWELNRPGHSLLHSSYLYVGTWYIDSVLGIRNAPDDVGFRKIVIHPPKYDDTALQWAKGYYNSPNGKISVNWQKRDSERLFQMKVTIPVNATAQIYVPSTQFTGIATSNRVKYIKDIPGYSIFEVGSGSYDFRSRLK